MYKFKKTIFSPSISKPPGELGGHTLEVKFSSAFSPSDFLGEIILWMNYFYSPEI